MFDLLSSTSLEDWHFVSALATALNPCPHGRLRGIRACEFCDYDERCPKCGGPTIPVDHTWRAAERYVYPVRCERAADGWFCATAIVRELRDDGYRARLNFYGHLVTRTARPFLGANA